MNDGVESLLHDVKNGKVPIGEALDRLRAAPFAAAVGAFACVDHHRGMRCGFPEVVFGLGKTPEDVARIADEILSRGSDLLVTRVTPEQVKALRASVPDVVHEERARCAVVRRQKREAPPGTILVLAAGTSDSSVAEEARVTAETLGNKVETLYDVGVAGIHRLLNRVDVIQRANVLIVCAGMEGALPSVVGGLVDRPVIAVPTSVGYGASMGGLAALLAMLNSCASGVVVVNIDNGFGAGYAASLMNRALHAPRKSSGTAHP